LVKTLRDARWEEGLEPVEGEEDPNHRLDRGRLGVVHSFTGTVEEMKELVRRFSANRQQHIDPSQLTFGLYIGVNGCSLKTTENLQVVSQIPLSRLMLETGTSTDPFFRTSR
jgi:TatD DNase family protein